MSDSPICPKCGVELTSGMMAAMCPAYRECEFWPEDKESQDFMEMMRAPKEG